MRECYHCKGVNGSRGAAGSSVPPSTSVLSDPWAALFLAWEHRQTEGKNGHFRD